jgi:hypothetical protein
MLKKSMKKRTRFVVNSTQQEVLSENEEIEASEVQSPEKMPLVKKALSIDLSEDVSTVQPVSINQPRIYPSSVQPVQQNQLKDEKRKQEEV